jgi:hypothetical protein
MNMIHFLEIWLCFAPLFLKRIVRVQYNSSISGTFQQIVVNSKERQLSEFLTELFIICIDPVFGGSGRKQAETEVFSMTCAL